MKSILIIFLSLSFIIEIPAQNLIKSKCDTCAILSGKILDADTKEPLIGANVELLTTNIGAATDINGDYIVKNIKPGLYNIQYSYIGYSKRKIENVLLKPNERRTIDIELPDWGEDYAMQADEDIKNGDIKILIGGLPVFCAPFDDINDLCEEYGFRYELMGCSFLSTSKYNAKVYKYLDGINGEGWKEKFEKELDELCEEYSKKY